MKKIKITCTGTKNINYKKFTDLQGGLGELPDQNREKLKNSILKYGFSFPVFCWKNSGKLFIIDAHQRIKVLQQLEDEGYLIPDLPACFIDAKNTQEAKEKILLQISQYKIISDESFYEFIKDSNLETNFSTLKLLLDIPDIDFKKIEETYINPTNKDREISEESLLTEHKCPKCGYEW